MQVLRSIRLTVFCASIGLFHSAAIFLTRFHIGRPQSISDAEDSIRDRLKQRMRRSFLCGSGFLGLTIPNSKMAILAFMIILNSA